MSDSTTWSQPDGRTLALEPDGAVPLPPTASSRREVDGAQRAVLLLASQYSAQRMTLLQSEPLLDAVAAVLQRTGATPEELVRALTADGRPDTLDPAGSLVARCGALSLATTDPIAMVGPPVPVVAPPLGGPPASPPTSPPVTGAATRSATDPAPRVGPPPGTFHSYVPRRSARVRQRQASRGWRRNVRRFSGGLIRLAPGPDEQVENALVVRAQASISGFRHVVVLSLKGGSGKTTTTVMLGHTFASHRRDRVVAIDASPDAGTLAYRIAEEPTTSVRTLLDSADSMRRYVDVRSLSGHTASRLDVVASDADPGVTRPFGSSDYRSAAEILTRFYSLVLTDCGAGLMHDAMGSILDSADQIVLVMTPAVDGVRSADLTLDWLDAHGFSDLVRGCVAVVNGVARRPVIDLDGLRAHFGSRCRAVVEIPRDDHLLEGADTDLSRLAPRVRRSYLTLAAVVADGFEDPSVRRSRAR